jgi:hypothetical protein
MNEPVGDEGKRDCRASEDDRAQASAARFGRAKSYPHGGPGAAETELPARMLSLNLIEFCEHRFGPVEPLGRQPSNRKPEEPARAIVLASGAEDSRDRNQEQHHHDDERQYENRGYVALRSSGSRRLFARPVGRGARVADCSSPAAFKRYRWRGGRPDAGLSSHFESSSPRSQSRTRIG